LSVKLLTISDRAFENKYESGDLSGVAMKEFINDHPETFQPYNDAVAVVPDN